MFYLIVFRARSETMKFYSILSSYGVKSEIVNTPRQISVACGISLKISSQDVPIAKEILTRRQFNTFAGIYLGSGTFQKY
ncbi:MAG: DUF3343 domain-containing protein [Clostridia bacterium]|nr:DUF3343 domain-containing protein [Clostridia bacterium]